MLEQNYAMWGVINHEGNQEERKRFWKFIMIHEWFRERPRKERKRKKDKYKNFNTFQPAAALAPVQREDQHQTPWQGLGENYQRDPRSATCLTFAGWCYNKTQRCRIPGN